MRKLALLPALALAVPVLSATPNQDHSWQRDWDEESVFNLLDRNGDGLLGRAEWRGSRMTFNEQDSNRDRYISRGEFVRGGYFRDIFQNIDRNNDGMIGRGEWVGNTRSFRLHDGDRDGYLSPGEMSAAGGEAGRERESGPIVDYGRPAAFEALDTNRNGVLDGHEWTFRRDTFHNLDRNQDSVLGLSEFNNLTSLNLNALDANADGRISVSEWPGGRDWFQSLDTDRNGSLSAEEYLNRGAGWERSQRFDAWDTNGNNLLEHTEWKSDPRLFTILDRNFDTRVSRDEFLEGRREVFLEDFDRNNDGMISRSEWRGPAADFARLDMNRNGVLDSEEFFYRGGPEEREARFVEIDSNRDGLIEGNEWHGDKRLFRSLDADNSGTLTWNEFDRR